MELKAPQEASQVLDNPLAEEVINVESRANFHVLSQSMILKAIETVWFS